MSDIDPSGSKRDLEFLRKTKDSYEVKCGRHYEHNGSDHTCQGVIPVYPILLIDGSILVPCIGGTCRGWLDRVYKMDLLTEKEKSDLENLPWDKILIPDFGEVGFTQVKRRERNYQMNSQY